MQAVNHMRALYQHIYREPYDKWVTKQHTRKTPHMRYRHVVRTLTRRAYEHITLDEVSRAEGFLLQTNPVYHDSIINSIKAYPSIRKQFPRHTKKIERYSRKISGNDSSDLQWELTEKIRSLPIGEPRSVLYRLLSRDAVILNVLVEILEEKELRQGRKF